MRLEIECILPYIIFKGKDRLLYFAISPITSDGHEPYNGLYLYDVKTPQPSDIDLDNKLKLKIIGVDEV
jgi:hypothetical protein